MAEKQKQKARQTSLADSSEEKDKPDFIDRLVSQAFDADPKVRLNAAQELGKTDDPRAIFALIELSSDKDEAVKAAAQAAIGHYKETEQEAIVSLEKLFAARKEITPEEVPQVRQRMMPTLEKLFAHYEPKKRDSVKRKLLPSLEKLFGLAPSHPQSDPLHELEKISPIEHEQQEQIPKENAPNFPFGQPQNTHENPQAGQKEDLAGQETQVQSEMPNEDEPQGSTDLPADLAQNKYFLLAYKIATTPGMGKAALKREQNRIMSNIKKEISLAFKMAEKQAAQEGLASFANIKPGARRLSFSEMQVVSIEDIDFGAGAKKKPFAKIKLSDGQREMAVLIPSERAAGISTHDKIALKNVSSDFLVEEKEVVLVVKKNSKVIVVK